mgnify:FL=1
METVTIHPGTARGIFVAPPSKSAAHRALICAGLADGESVIENLSLSDDIAATVDCLQALGAHIHIDGNTAHVTGCTPTTRQKSTTLPCRESGSTLRFFLPLALLSNVPAVMTGSERLMQRPLDVYETLGQAHHFSITHRSNEILVQGRLSPGTFSLRGDISSQFVTGLCFALPLLTQDSQICLLPPVESQSYIALTRIILEIFGVRTESPDRHNIIVPGNQHYHATHYTVEGDHSGAAFFHALNTLGGHVSIQGLQHDSTQGDRVATVLLSELQKGYAHIDLSDCPDLAPIFFAVAGLLHGATFTGTHRLKIKESDRAHAMQQELKKCGISLDVGENEVIVHGSTPHFPSVPIEAHNDHRIVMAMAVLLSQTGGVIQDAQVVRKSMPDFFARLEALGITVEHTFTDT